jgi:hypothetical protein
MDQAVAGGGRVAAARRAGRAIAGALALLGAAGAGQAVAQAVAPPGILADGNAVVTGFSGARLAPSARAGPDAAARTFVDPAGPVLRIVDLQAPGAPPRAQLVFAPKPFTLTAGQIGQVFALALDGATPPNVYAAATSVYGLPIVVPDADGDGLPDRQEEGAPNAYFMPGLFGPPALGGGPGAIWRIDGASGAVALFATVMLDGVPNGGPALGGLAFDDVSGTLLAADRETGMIHRFDLAGAERGRYDHGVAGRPAAGLAAVRFDPARRADIRRPPFQPANPDSWGYAPPERRVFGLAVRGGRLYYAVAAGLQIWSVTILRDGAFGSDARVELTVPPGPGASEISKIAFDDRGHMILAERVAPSGAFDFVRLTEEGGGRVLRYAPLPGGGWQPAAQEYAVGFAAAMPGGNGGVAVGHGFDAAGRLDRLACAGFVWTTGEQLRRAPDPALAAWLAPGGPAAVNGLQGRPAERVGAPGAPALDSYFVDFDDRFDDLQARGYLGDVAVLRACARGAVGAPPTAAVVPPALAIAAPGQPVAPLPMPALPGAPAAPPAPVPAVVPPAALPVPPPGPAGQPPAGQPMAQQLVPVPGQVVGQIQPQQPVQPPGTIVQAAPLPAPPPGVPAAPGGAPAAPGLPPTAQGAAQPPAGGPSPSSGSILPPPPPPGTAAAGGTTGKAEAAGGGIAVTKTGPAKCHPGKACDFTITFRGTTATPSGAFQVAEAPPPGWIYLANASGPHWTCKSPADCTYNVTKHSQWPKQGLTDKSPWLKTNVAFRVPSDAKDGPVENCVSVTLPQGQAGTTILVACARVEVANPPNLTVTKAFDKPDCAPGGACNFMITVHNTGGAPYQGYLSLSDTALPQAFDFEGLSSSGSDAGLKCDNQGVGELGVFRCRKMGLGERQKFILAVKARLKPTAATAPVENCAKLWLPGTDPNDSLLASAMFVRDFLDYQGYATGEGGALSEADKKAIAAYKKDRQLKDAQGNPDTSGEVTDTFVKSVLPPKANASGDFLQQCVTIKPKEPGLLVHKEPYKYPDWKPGTPTCVFGRPDRPCGFTVKVSGRDESPYTKPIRIEEQLPPGFTYTGFRSDGAAKWSCSGQQQKAVCTHPPANLTSKDLLQVTVWAHLGVDEAVTFYGWAQDRNPEAVNCVKALYDDPTQYGREPKLPPAPGQVHPGRHWQACYRQTIYFADHNLLGYKAEGSGACYPPNCSYYDFTIVSDDPLGRGPLAQHITPPAGSAMGEIGIVKAPASCPAARWSCVPAGQGPAGAFDCRIDDCILTRGDQVVTRLQGSVAPDLRAPPPAPIQKTACGTLEWNAAALGGIEQQAGRQVRTACAAIMVLAQPPAALPTPMPPPPVAPPLEPWQTILPGLQQVLPARPRPGFPAPPAGAPSPPSPPPGATGAPVQPPPVSVQCTGGKLAIGGQCVCPAGTTEMRGLCVSVSQTAPQVQPMQPRLLPAQPLAR